MTKRVKTPHSPPVTDDDIATREDKLLTLDAILSGLTLDLKLPVALGILTITSAVCVHRYLTELANNIKNKFDQEAVKEAMDVTNKTSQGLVAFTISSQVIVAIFFAHACFVAWCYWEEKKQIQKKINHAKTKKDLLNLRNEQINIENTSLFSYLVNESFHSLWLPIVAKIISIYLAFQNNQIDMRDTNHFYFLLANAHESNTIEYTREYCYKENLAPNCEAFSARTVSSAQLYVHIMLLITLTIKTMAEKKMPIFYLGATQFMIKMIKKLHIEFEKRRGTIKIKSLLGEHVAQINRIVAKSKFNKLITSDVIDCGTLHAINIKAKNQSSSSKVFLSALSTLIKCHQQKEIISDPTHRVFIPYEDFTLPDDASIKTFIEAWQPISEEQIGVLKRKILTLLKETHASINITVNQDCSPMLIISVKTIAANYLKKHLTTNLRINAHDNELTLTGNITDCQTFVTKNKQVKELLQAHQTLIRAEKTGWMTRLRSTFFAFKGNAKATTSLASKKNSADSDDEIDVQAAAGPEKAQEPFIPETFKQWSNQHNDRPIYPSYNGQGIQNHFVFFVSMLDVDAKDPNEQQLARKLQDPNSYKFIPAGSLGETGIKSRKEGGYRFKIAGPAALFNVITPSHAEIETQQGEALWIFNKVTGAH